MIKEIADAAGIDQVIIYIILAILFISVVYSYNSTAGGILGLLAILGILTIDWKQRPVDISDLVK